MLGGKKYDLNSEIWYHRVNVKRKREKEGKKATLIKEVISLQSNGRITGEKNGRRATKVIEQAPQNQRFQWTEKTFSGL